MCVVNIRDLEIKLGVNTTRLVQRSSKLLIIVIMTYSKLSVVSKSLGYLYGYLTY